MNEDFLRTLHLKIYQVQDKSVYEILHEMFDLIHVDMQKFIDRLDELER